jgi:hypothetical protein
LTYRKAFEAGQTYLTDSKAILLRMSILKNELVVGQQQPQQQPEISTGESCHRRYGAAGAINPQMAFGGPSTLPPEMYMEEDEETKTMSTNNY